jgi:hypothetical protein
MRATERKRTKRVADGSNRGKVKPKRHEPPFGKAGLSEGMERVCSRRWQGYIAASPRNTEKVSGTPKSVIIGRFAEETQALRANRSANESR